MMNTIIMTTATIITVLALLEPMLQAYLKPA